MPPQPRSHNLNRFWFILGNAPLLSLAELFSFYPGALKTAIYLAAPGAAGLEAAVDKGQIAALGGIIKIARQIGDAVNLENAVEKIVQELGPAEGKINFGISVYGAATPHSKTALALRLGKDTKQALKTAGKNARFVDNRGLPTLNSASVTHNKLLDSGAEFLLIENNESYTLARTVAVQPFEELSNRDYGRPGRDDKSGMLPPKLALMMLNLAQIGKEAALLDPFCGSGTILTEAWLQGYTQLTGSDLSSKAVDDTQKNIAWLSQNMIGPASASSLKVFQADVRDLAKKVSKNSVDAIVTEPFLGPPLRGGEPAAVILKIIADLKPLYEEALRQFEIILKPGGTVIMVVPRWFSGGAWRTLSDQLPFNNKKFGLQPEPLLPKDFSKDLFGFYHRAGQHVGREIWRLKKTS